MQGCKITIHPMDTKPQVTDHDSQGQQTSEKGQCDLAALLRDHHGMKDVDDAIRNAIAG
jgi:hypothetical protein